MYTTQYVLFIWCNVVAVIKRRKINESGMKEMTNVCKSLAENLKEMSALGRIR